MMHLNLLDAKRAKETNKYCAKQVARILGAARARRKARVSAYVSGVRALARRCHLMPPLV